MPDFTNLLNSFSSSINGTTVLTIMGTVVGSSIGIFLAVWGGRKIINDIQNVINSGNISLPIRDRKYRKLGFRNKAEYDYYTYYDNMGWFD